MTRDLIKMATALFLILSPFFAVSAIRLLYNQISVPDKVWENPSPFLAGIIGFTGALLAFFGSLLIWYLNQWAIRKKQETDQENSLKSMVSAIRGEVTVSLERLMQQFNPFENADNIRTCGFNLKRAELLRQPQNGLPVGVALRENSIFDKHERDIFQLPELLLRALVRYYQNDSYLTLYVEAFSNGRFAELSIERKKMAIAHFFDLGQETLRSAIFARAMLSEFNEPTDKPLAHNAIRNMPDGVNAKTFSFDSEPVNFRKVFESLDPVKKTKRFNRIKRHIDYGIKRAVLGRA